MSSFGKKPGGGRRISARAQAPLMAVYTTTTQSNPTILVDVSCTGARLRGERLPSPGDELLLSMDRLRRFGKVAWVRRGECGVAFDEALHSAHVRHLQRLGAGSLDPELNAAQEAWTNGMAR